MKMGDFHMKPFSYAALLCAAATVAYAASPAVAPWGVDLSYIDKSVAPGDDFFAYANNGWLKTATIPPERSFAGVNLELDKQNEERLKTIVAGLHNKRAITQEEVKLRDFYDAFTDQAAIEKTGMSRADEDLKQIAALNSADDVARAMGNPRMGVDGPFGIYLGIDDKHPTNYSVNVYQSGLGMPDRDYYLRDGKDLDDARAAYKKYVAEMLGCAGVKDAAAR